MHTKEVLKRLLILPPIVVGAAALAYVVSTRMTPDREPASEITTRVTVVAAQQLDVVPRALGFGTVQPQAVWQAVAEVQGRIIDMPPELRKGAILPAGTVLFEIDPVDYRLRVAEADANLRVVMAEIADLDIKETNTKASIAIEKKAAAVSRRERDRKRSLVERKALSQSALDTEESNLLIVQQRVQDLQNTLNRVPVERDLKRAERALYEARLEEARRDVSRTMIRAPFDLRIAELNVEKAQFAATGTALAIGDSIDIAEVTAQFAIERVRDVVRIEPPQGGITTANLSRLPDIIDLEATVRLRTANHTFEWPARFARINDTIDPQTRTVGIIVAVDAPYARAQPGDQPPLVKGMYVEVEVRGPPRPNLIVVPRAALWNGFVYVVDNESRLRQRKVDVELVQTNFAAISAGLSAGERVVVGDLIPAIEGMLLDPVDDAALGARIAAEAAGTTDVK